MDSVCVRVSPTAGPFITYVTMAGDVAPWEECLHSVHKALGSSPHHCINKARWCASAIPTLRGQKQKEQKFKANLGYIVNLRSPGAT